MIKNFKIGNKNIGENFKSFVVAEMSGNHLGKLKNALKIVRLAKKCGADAIKLQTYKPNTITLNSNKKDFKIPKKSPWFKYKNLWNLYNNAHTPWEWHRRIFQEARKNKLSFFSSPFDETAVDFLEKIGCQAYKIASPEINHIPLIEKISKTNKPVILSTGLASYAEIKTAVNILKKNKSKKIIILKCSSSYPADYNELNLLTMSHIKKKFKSLVGFSDHTIGSIAPLTSVVLGGKMIEKHFIFDQKINSVDNFFSAGPHQFKEMVNQIRSAERSIGKITYKLSKKSKISLNGKRSIYVSNNIYKGQKISKNNIKVVRPSYGLNPKLYKSVLGKKTIKNLKAGSRLEVKFLK
tara:strand:- start:55826 stop:56881 length:1056 start_codon:yes stop_codon:yes gene_type:complete